MIQFESPEKRLLRLLREHAGQYTIDDDVVVATDFNHPEVRRRMIEEGEAIDRLFSDQISAAGGDSPTTIAGDCMVCFTYVSSRSRPFSSVG